MDIAEMVDQLLEKKLWDIVNANMGNRTWQRERVDEILGDMMTEQINAMFDARRDDIKAKVAEYFDKCELKVSKSYSGIDVNLVKPEESQ